jgi:acyl carrier protein
MTQHIQCHERLTKVFREIFDDPSLEIKDEYNASDIPGWDSLAHVNLVVSIEDEFDIKFTTAEIASLTCVGDAKELILTRARL